MSRRLVALAALVAALLLADGMRRTWPRTVDDAFITFRYADNLVRGYGPVWNPGERVEGYSSPSFMLLAAGALALGLDAVGASKTLGLVATFALWGAVGAFLLRRRVHASGVAAAWLLLGGSAVVQIWAVAGLETNVFALLVFLGLARLAEGERPVEASAWLAAAALTRPEGLLYWLAGMPFAGRKAGWYALPGAALAAHLLWRLAYYGAPLPNTYYAKTGGGLAMWRQGLAGLELFTSSAAHLPWLALALAGAGAGLRRPHTRRGTLIFAGAVAGHLLWIVSVGDDGLRVHRFYVPLLAPLAVLAARAFGAGERPSRPRAALGLFAVAVSVLGSTTLLHRRLLPGLHEGGLAYQRGNIELGRVLAERPADTTLAVAAAGAIPYYARLPTIDMYGLNDATIAHGPFPTTDRGRLMKWNNASVLAREPDVIVPNRGHAPTEADAEAVRRNPGLLAGTEMDRDLLRRVLASRQYALREVGLPSGGTFFVLERRLTRTPRD